MSYLFLIQTKDTNYYISYGNVNKTKRDITTNVRLVTLQVNVIFSNEFC